MSIFAISDLHLSLGTDKPMDIFGGNWKNYEEKLEKNWRELVTDDDTVILNGDNSWATYIEHAVEDFTFINKLPGKKLLGKGNHDYWWTTAKKMREFCDEHGFDTIAFLHNNHFMYEGFAVCGSRGWQLTKNDAEDKKIYERELSRLEFSITSAKKQAVSAPGGIIAALHYPPDAEFISLLKKHDVKTCIYGHLHGFGHKNVLNSTIDGIKFYLVSCDFLQFTPFQII